MDENHKIEDMTHGLVVIDKRDLEASTDGNVTVLHFCGYWHKPTKADAEDLMRELRETPEFGVQDILPHIGIFEAQPELVAEYKADILAGKYDEVVQTEPETKQ